MKIHDPHHVAQLAALMLSAQADPERHHIKKAIDCAVILLDESILRAEADEAKAEAAEQAREQAPVKSETDGSGKSPD